jgi:radical SAM superfamily enzyme YgiQ (UPF0313 family)
MNVVLINPYELGRQPFGLAEPAAWLQREGCAVRCCDLSIQKLEAVVSADSDLVAIYIAMHTATRIAVEALPRIRALAPQACLCVYGLYAPMNAELFRSLGVDMVVGGEFEPALVSLVKRIRAGEGSIQTEPVVSLEKIDFITPARDTLPPLDRYASLILPDKSNQTVGFAETTRGCKYHCRHCPVVPVYQGTFRVIPAALVLEDIRGQVAQGAQHISFGDPDFFNGPGHALRIVHAMHDEFPDLTYDATIKIEHIVRYPDAVRELKTTGCLFIISAVEAMDDDILERLDKGHTRDDFITALGFLRETGIALSPTFVAFTPWTTLEGYIRLLQDIIDLRLVNSVAPVQLSIRLLVPAGSCILQLEDARDMIGEFDSAILGHAWRNPDPRVDELQRRVQAWIGDAEERGLSRPDIFRGIRKRAFEIAGMPLPPPDLADAGESIPRLSENWYCCAEPTCEQLNSF